MNRRFFAKLLAPLALLLAAPKAVADSSRCRVCGGSISWPPVKMPTQDREFSTVKLSHCGTCNLVYFAGGIR